MAQLVRADGDDATLVIVSWLVGNCGWAVRTSTGFLIVICCCCELGFDCFAGTDFWW